MMRPQLSTKTVTIAIVLSLVGLGIVGSLATSDSTPESIAEQTLTWHSFDEGVTLAQRENKKVLVDVYTDWCGWCKKMDKEVYADNDIVKILSAHYVAVKLNPEKSEVVTFGGEKMGGGQFAQAMGVTGYPCTVILGSDGKPITKIDGYQEVKGFSTILRFVGEDHYKTKSFQEFKSSSQNNTEE